MLDTAASDQNKDLTFFTELVCASPPVETMTPLDLDFSPGDDDVLCGRGKVCYNHKGNQRFREIVASFLPRYSTASSKLEKSLLVSSIVDAVRDKSPLGGFVKQDKSGRWYEVGDSIAREKIGQTFRDFLHTQYRSSTQSKKKRRKSQLARSMSCSPEVSNTPEITMLQRSKSCQG